eukprot:12451148-Alexandrium_andersonii.AAC.2
MGLIDGEDGEQALQSGPGEGRHLLRSPPVAALSFLQHFLSAATNSETFGACQALSTSSPSERALGCCANTPISPAKTAS